MKDPDIFFSGGKPIVLTLDFTNQCVDGVVIGAKFKIGFLRFLRAQHVPLLRHENLISQSLKIVNLTCSAKSPP